MLVIGGYCSHPTCQITFVNILNGRENMALLLWKFVCWHHGKHGELWIERFGIKEGTGKFNVGQRSFDRVTTHPECRGLEIHLLACPMEAGDKCLPAGQF